MRKVLLCILDGFGYSKRIDHNAIASANTPNIKAIMSENPHSLIVTDGPAVGLPEGQMGNSEVGHATIGCGRILEQTIVTINNSLSSGLIKQNQEVKQIIAKGNAGRLHMVGMYSFGGIHSSAKHLHNLVRMFGQAGKEVILHLFADGRDVSPKSFAQDVLRLSDVCSGLNVRLATICGRYYGMDRDNRDERTSAAFNAIAFGKASQNLYAPEGTEEDGTNIIGIQLGKKNSKEAVGVVSNIFNAFYKHGITDEFIQPAQINDYNGIEELDDIFFFNFRADRMLQLVTKFIALKGQAVRAKNSNEQGKVQVGKKNGHKHGLTRDKLGKEAEETGYFKGQIFTAVNYFGNKENGKHAKVIFPKQPVHNTLGEIIERASIKQFRIAETEKYAHVTYFFNAGREEPFEGETRIMVPSPLVATYDLVPEMSAQMVCRELEKAIKSDTYSFAVANFANCDMVGHTGNFRATIKAVECLDKLIGELTATALQHNWEVIITADHGNAEEMLDAKGVMHTQHTLNPVPLICIGPFCSKQQLRDGSLPDIAPTILEIMGIQRPIEMTGKPLIRH